MPISNEENRRFEELMNTLGDMKEKVTKESEKHAKLIGAKPVLLIFLMPLCLASLIASVVITNIPLGVISFVVMTVLAERLSKIFWK
jgi:hypothetical protein